MKALVFHEPEHISVDERADPTPSAGEVVIQVSAAAICHSDIRVYRGLKHARPGVIPGHEIAGTVVELGTGVENVRCGDRVAVCPIVACGHCFFCVSGRRHRCPERRTLGYDEDGGLAEYMLVPAPIVQLGHLLPIPPALPRERACLTEPLACVLNSLETCGVKGGSSLLIMGAGPMGLLHLLLARALGAETIVVSEPDEARGETARGLGATEVINPRKEDLAATVQERTAGLGADAVVITAGLPKLVEEGLASVRRQGTVNLFAGFPPKARVALDPNAIHYSEVNLTGSQNASPQQYRRALGLLAHLPQIDAVTTHRYPLADATNAYEVRLRNEGLKSMVLVSDDAAST